MNAKEFEELVIKQIKKMVEDRKEIIRKIEVLEQFINGINKEIIPQQEALKRKHDRKNTQHRWNKKQTQKLLNLIKSKNTPSKIAQIMNMRKEQIYSKKANLKIEGVL